MDGADRGVWTRRIQEHNDLNGQVFSTIEFALLVAAALFIAYAFGIHHRSLGAILFIGVAANACVIVAFGAAALIRGERGSGLRKMFDRDHRAEVYAGHPDLMRDTMKLSGVVFVPFYLLYTTLLERWRRRQG